MFYYIMLHLPKTLSSGAQQPAGSVHTCQHVTVTFLLRTTVLISIYFQTNAGGKVSIRASGLRVMAGVKVPLSLPSLSESHRMADEAQISSSISAVACYLRNPVCSIKMSGPGPGRKAEVQADRSGRGLIGVHHCPLHLEECHPPCLWHLTYQPYATQRRGRKGGQGWPGPPFNLIGHPWCPTYQSQTEIGSWFVCIMDGLLNGPTGLRLRGIKAERLKRDTQQTQNDYKDTKKTIRINTKTLKSPQRHEKQM